MISLGSAFSFLAQGAFHIGAIVVALSIPALAIKRTSLPCVRLQAAAAFGAASCAVAGWILYTFGALVHSHEFQTCHIDAADAQPVCSEPVTQFEFIWDPSVVLLSLPMLASIIPIPLVRSKYCVPAMGASAVFVGVGSGFSMSGAGLVFAPASFVLAAGGSAALLCFVFHDRHKQMAA